MSVVLSFMVLQLWFTLELCNNKKNGYGAFILSLIKLTGMCLHGPGPTHSARETAVNELTGSLRSESRQSHQTQSETAAALVF